MQLPFGLACSVVLLALGLSGPAHAVRIEPVATPYTATGPITFSKGVLGADCTITLSGQIAEDGSQASVDSVSFSGRSFQCRRVTATHLPWTFTPVNLVTGEITGIQVNVRAPLVGGNCGPTNALSIWNPEQNSLRTENVELEGGCSIEQMTIHPSPAFRAVPTGAP